jgi:GNAT superfamily N-acetyltransferase
MSSYATLKCGSPRMTVASWGFAALSVDLLEHLYVHPQAESRGIGTALLALSKDRRPGGLRLWVFQKNSSARRFYERHGFRLVQLTDGRGNEEGEPDALYEWQPTNTSAQILP